MGIRLKPVCFAIICALIVNLTSNYASTSQEKIKLTKLDNCGKTAVQPTFDTNIYLGDDYKVEFLSTTNTSQDWFYHLTAFSEAPKTTIDPQDFIEDFAASVESHSRIMAETAETAQKFCYLYRIENDLDIFDSDGKVIGSIKKGALFTGAESDDDSGLIVIDYEYSTLTVDKENIKKLDNAVVLPTAAIGQWGGDIYGICACGPTAMTILVDWEKSADVNKDELIRFSKENKLEDQGAIDEPHGGMTAPRLVELSDGYFGGEITARNIYDDDPLEILDDQLDNGHRALVAVRYTSVDKIVENAPYSGVHFVVICGYEEKDGKRSYYYADPYFGDGGDTLLKVSGEKLENSMEQVDSEPKTLIVLE